MFYGMNIPGDSVRGISSGIAADSASQNSLFGYLPDSVRTIDAEARQKEKDAQEAFSAVQKGDWPMLGLMFGLSLMANSERNGFGSALGRAGLDTLGSYANTTAARRKEFTEAQERAIQNRRLDNAEARQAFANRIALGQLLQQGRHNDLLERKNLFDAFQKFWKEHQDAGPFLRAMSAVYSRVPQASPGGIASIFGAAGTSGANSPGASSSAYGAGLPVVPIPGIPGGLLTRQAKETGMVPAAENKGHAPNAKDEAPASAAASSAPESAQAAAKQAIETPAAAKAAPSVPAALPPWLKQKGRATPLQPARPAAQAVRGLPWRF